MGFEDKLTRAERIRLEAFAQAGQRCAMARPTITLAKQFKEAEAIERWLKQARDDS